MCNSCWPTTNKKQRERFSALPVGGSKDAARRKFPALTTTQAARAEHFFKRDGFIWRAWRRVIGEDGGWWILVVRTRAGNGRDGFVWRRLLGDD
ncbi:hypothetical protein JTE90_013115 [Oedothorax gibbosus]|uniref:Uncharacterized protein n=1 Tax=Oedothorax gibbosus TaxID=931172 RepID=A0AAV6U5M8_9ARAC|nr:hypothetical protein JTE90_013115 [Oedothorax gibbosus]